MRSSPRLSTLDFAAGSCSRFAACLPSLSSQSLAGSPSYFTQDASSSPLHLLLTTIARSPLATSHAPSRLKSADRSRQRVHTPSSPLLSCPGVLLASYLKRRIAGYPAFPAPAHAPHTVLWNDPASGSAALLQGGALGCGRVHLVGTQLENSNPTISPGRSLGSGRGKDLRTCI